MRIRQLKNVFGKILLAGLFIYMVLYILQDDGEQSSLPIFSENTRNSDLNVDELDTNRIERLANSLMGDLRQMQKANGATDDENRPPLDLGKEYGDHKPPPKPILDVILQQVPGGLTALRKNDEVAVDKFHSLLKDFKNNFNSNPNALDASKKFSAHLYDNQKKMGPLPDIREEMAFHDPNRKYFGVAVPGGASVLRRMEMFQNQLQHRLMANPSFGNALAALMNGNKADGNNNANLAQNFLQNLKQNMAGAQQQFLQNGQQLGVNQNQWNQGQQMPQGQPGMAPYQQMYGQQVPQGQVLQGPGFPQRMAPMQQGGLMQPQGQFQGQIMQQGQGQLQGQGMMQPQGQMQGQNQGKLSLTQEQEMALQKLRQGFSQTKMPVVGVNDRERLVKQYLSTNNDDGLQKFLVAQQTLNNFANPNNPGDNPKVENDLYKKLQAMKEKNPQLWNLLNPAVQGNGVPNLGAQQLNGAMGQGVGNVGNPLNGIPNGQNQLNPQFNPALNPNAGGQWQNPIPQANPNLKLGPDQNNEGYFNGQNNPVQNFNNNAKQFGNFNPVIPNQQGNLQNPAQQMNQESNNGLVQNNANGNNYENLPPYPGNRNAVPNQQGNMGLPNKGPFQSNEPNPGVPNASAVKEDMDNRNQEFLQMQQNNLAMMNGQMNKGNINNQMNGRGLLQAMEMEKQVKNPEIGNQEIRGENQQEIAEQNESDIKGETEKQNENEYDPENQDVDIIHVSDELNIEPKNEEEMGNIGNKEDRIHPGAQGKNGRNLEGEVLQENLIKNAKVDIDNQVDSNEQRQLVQAANQIQGHEQRSKILLQQAGRKEKEVEERRKEEKKGKEQQEKDRERSKRETNSTGLIYMSDQEFEILLDEQSGGVTKMSRPDMTKIRVVVVDKEMKNGGVKQVTKALEVNQYMKWKAVQYVRRKANPFPKKHFRPTLMPYPDSILRPNPKMLIKDLSTFVDNARIEKELGKERNRRIILGDEDIRKIPEVIEEVNAAGDHIPNIVHFIWFSCHRYRVHHFMSMKSALEIQKPKIILFHTNCEPNGTYWEEFLALSKGRLRIVKRTPPTNIWGRDVEKVEHRSDVARLQILLEIGGIYMDDDILILKSLDSLRNNSMVLGEENYDALANSIIMANRDSWFLRRWFQEYQTFNKSQWSHSSCFVPWSLWLLFPSTIHVVKEKMLRPNWEEIKYIYHELWDWSNNYSIHLYSRFMPILDGTPERSLRELSILNTTYGEMSRYVLWGDKRPKDITDFV